MPGLALQSRTGRDCASQLVTPLVLAGWDRIANLPPCQDVGQNVDFSRAGAPCHNVVLIRRGVVKLKCLGSNGREMIVAIRAEGWFLGAEEALLGHAFRCTATTITPCEVSFFPRDEFLTEIHQNRELSIHVMRSLSWCSQAHLTAQVELRSETAQQRLEHFLRDLQALADVTGTERPALSQVELAQMVSVTPEHLCRIMGRKRQEY